jgi:hypothetical protein
MSKRNHPMVDGVVDAFGNWLKRSRDIREMRELDSSELVRVARELNVSDHRSGYVYPSRTARGR